MTSTNSSRPTRFHRLSYKNVGCTSISSPVFSVSCMRQKMVVSLPKASRFMKLPQRPISWPISRPITIRSVSAHSLKPLRFAMMTASSTTAMTVP